MSTMTDAEAIKMAMEMVLAHDLFPAKVYVADKPFDSEPPPEEVVLVDITSHNRPHVIKRLPYSEFMMEVKKCTNSPSQLQSLARA